TSRMGLSVIRGLQGETREGYAKLFACAKHYAVHSGPEWNRHSFNAKNVDPRDLWETYLPAFKTAVTEGKVKQVMCAYNRFEGEPCCASDRLLRRILREEWGFDGFVVSDCWALENFFRKGRHETHPDSAHAVADAILKGTDLECGEAFEAIPRAVAQGLIPEAALDIPLMRLLRARFELGEMDGYSPWDALPDSLINSRRHRQLALEMARKSIVLLRNNNLLPLPQNTRIALMGPAAGDSVMQWGNYHGFPPHTVTLLEALQPYLGSGGTVCEIERDYIGKYANLLTECRFEDKPGGLLTLWNNRDLKGKATLKRQTADPVNLPRYRKWDESLEMNNVSALFQTTFTPGKSGAVELVIASPCQIEVRIDGQVVQPELIPTYLKVVRMAVSAGRSYDIRIEARRGEERGEFKVSLQRLMEPDFAKMLAAVGDAEVVIYAGGISAELEREDATVYAPGFQGGDRTSIELPGPQRSVIAALKQAGKKVVLVNFSGSAMGLVPESGNCEAILQAWYPGEAGGLAIAEVLYGKVNPAGRLPVTFYKNVDQLPDFQSYDMAGRTYRYLKESPLYPFGFGLSYTTFGYGKPVLDKKEARVGESVTLTVPVTNSGMRDGEEVVQVYLSKTGDADGPVRALRAFDRVKILAGETRQVRFVLDADNLEWWDAAAGRMRVHPGVYRVMVGGSSAEKDLTTISLTLK
ncbi:MAG TPA: glycoside hydrolase family 3 C-terminal domain-containing protein, partial [Calditrichia bacterium]|nr:glycoside hydrolase family 3 C-terminal domain-containing protein [Calditrichia bacterium]